MCSASLASSKVDISPCRICLGDDLRDLENPLITPCKCSGSMKFIHLECLKSWIKQRVTITQKQNSINIYWKSLSCELCKSPYPFAIYFQGRIFELIKVTPPKKPYIVLEALSKDMKETIGICIVSFANSKEIDIVLQIFLYIY